MRGPGLVSLTPAIEKKTRRSMMMVEGFPRGPRGTLLIGRLSVAPWSLGVSRWAFFPRARHHPEVGRVEQGPPEKGKHSACKIISASKNPLRFNVELLYTLTSLYKK